MIESDEERLMKYLSRPSFDEIFEMLGVLSPQLRGTNIENHEARIKFFESHNWTIDEFCEYHLNTARIIRMVNSK